MICNLGHQLKTNYSRRIAIIWKSASQLSHSIARLHCSCTVKKKKKTTTRKLLLDKSFSCLSVPMLPLHVRRWLCLCLNPLKLQKWSVFNLRNITSVLDRVLENAHRKFCPFKPKINLNYFRCEKLYFRNKLRTAVFMLFFCGCGCVWCARNLLINDEVLAINAL